MSIVLHHHPHSRAAHVVWMLEEVGQPYTLQPVDLTQGAQKSAAHKALNPMGKVPVLQDGPVVLTEGAAIGVYLADRYASGRLAPALDHPDRAPFLRWCFYSPSVVEPGCMAHAAGWTYKPGSAGWGTYPEMLDTLDAAIGDGPWLLGDRFTMADVVLGGTMQWMLQFGMLEKRDRYTDYAARLSSRPARHRADARNAAALAELSA